MASSVSLFLTLSLTLCILVSLLLTLNIVLSLHHLKNVRILASRWTCFKFVLCPYICLVCIKGILGYGVFFEVAIESWSEWDLNPLNMSVAE